MHFPWGKKSLRFVFHPTPLQMKLQANTKTNGRLKNAPASLYRALRSRPPKTAVDRRKPPTAQTAEGRGRDKVKQGHLFSEAFAINLYWPVGSF